MEEAVLAAFDDAQRRGFALLRDVMNSLSAGTTEAQAADAARDLASRHGFDRWYHPPEILFGENTRSNDVWKTPGARKLKRGDMVSVTLGPSSADAYADVGVTEVFGAPDGAEEPKVLTVARECARATSGYASQWKTVGELYIYARAWAVNHRLTLVNDRSIGHALLPPEGNLAVGFPLSAHTITWLRRYQVRRLNPNRVTGLWAIRPNITDGTVAAQFEEVIYVNGPDKRILGRDDISQVGTY